MIEFNTIASGSSGNCHILKSNDTIGLIDIGIQWKQIQKAMDFKTSNLDFVLSTHRHFDHCGYLKDAIKAGIDCYAIQDVWDSNGIISHRAHTIIPKKTFTIKSLSIMAFDLPHDVPNVGFLIRDKERSKLLYLVDCNYCPYRFHGLTLIALGINYDTEILVDNITCGYLNLEVGKRMLKNHMSIETAKGFFRANDMSKVEEIYLLHLSDGNSDEDYFKKTVEEITGKPVYSETKQFLREL